MLAETNVIAPAAHTARDLTDTPGLTVLAEDGAILAVAKPSGLVVHPAYRHPDGTLTDAVFAYADDRGWSRPWLLHRLDRETSGVVLFARTDQARRTLVRQFQQRQIAKRYLALVLGRLPNESGDIDALLCRDADDRRRVIVSPEGKPSRTRYRVLATRGDFSLALAEPLTGRTHQIRAHLAHVSAPLAGDATYSGVTEATIAAGITRAQLHAWELAFRHPVTGSSVVVCAPLPDDMRATLVMLGLEKGIATLPGL